MRLLQCGDEGSRLVIAVCLRKVGMPLSSVGRECIWLPSSLTEPISIGTFFEISGATSEKDRTLTILPSRVGDQPTRGGAGSKRAACPAHRRIDLGDGGIAGSHQL